VNIRQQLKTSQKRPNFIFSLYLEFSGMRTLYAAYLLHKHQQQLASRAWAHQQQQTASRLPS
jgi:hypothetical protein